MIRGTFRATGGHDVFAAERLRLCGLQQVAVRNPEEIARIVNSPFAGAAGSGQHVGVARGSGRRHWPAEPQDVTRAAVQGRSEVKVKPRVRPYPLTHSVVEDIVQRRRPVERTRPCRRRCYAPIWDDVDAREWQTPRLATAQNALGG
mmetsp:Transcript_51912/g.117135  ORF Transcript_51912/g.117135 Transcript_51912/m.117135 type:complete len:147 (+) Transcript_51912:214-654(+)